MDKLLAEIDQVGEAAARLPDAFALEEFARIERRILDRLRDHRQVVAVRMRMQTEGCDGHC